MLFYDNEKFVRLDNGRKRNFMLVADCKPIFALNLNINENFRFLLYQKKIKTFSCLSTSTDINISS